MALHTQLPIYRTGLELLSLAHRVQEQMPRGMKCGHAIEGMHLNQVFKKKGLIQ